MTLLQQYNLVETIYETRHLIARRGYRNTDRLPVLIKLLKGGYPSLRETAQLRHDYSLTWRLDHPGILRPLALERHEGSLALITEDVPGGPLHQLLLSKRLDLDQALRVATLIADVLDAIHKHGILYKNLRPQTLCVSLETDQIKLLDFGVATRLSHEAQLTRDEDFLEGTLAYISPEQTGRIQGAIDQRSDLYSLGVMLYEMLTGAAPFIAVDQAELIHSHIAKIPRAPRDVVPEIPEVVSAMVMKLLSKAPEERYQTAFGLKTDLDRCLSSLRETHRLDAFALGVDDFSGELRIPEKLRGRDAEIAALTAALDDAMAAEAGLVLVSGHAGVGKSSLVSELQKAAARRRVYYVSGKFDQLSWSTPYSSLVHAFQELVQQVLSEAAGSVALWKERLAAVLGQNAQVLVDIIPDLSLLLGPQQRVPELAPTEAQNRLNLVFQSFVNAFASGDHALVVFFDDLQWADPASLRLLGALLTAPDTHRLLFVGAYRAEEVDDAHPLSFVLNEVMSAGKPIRKLVLSPLSPRDVSELVTDTLFCDEQRAAPLAAFLFERTQGNPFFIHQVLTRMHEEGRLKFDPSSREWTWHTAGIDTMEVTADVADFVVERLRRLSPETMRLLSHAACIGHYFDLQALSLLHDRSPAETAAQLWEALEHGFIVPLDADYRFLSTNVAAEMIELAGSESLDISYKFLHDRVQQAAYSLISDEARRAVSLRLGRWTREHAARSGRAEALFTALNHLNAAAALIDDPEERRDVARLNLLVGKKAKAAAAFDAAVKYLRAGMALLGADGFTFDYPLSFALHAERAECEILLGWFPQADVLLDILRSRAQTTFDRVHVHNLHLVHYTTIGRFDSTEAAGRAALAELGIELPEPEEAQKAAMESLSAEVLALLSGRTTEEIAAAPPLADPTLLAATDVLSNLIAPAFYRPSLFNLVSAMLAAISLKHGHTESSALAYVIFANVLVTTNLARRSEARQLREAALKLDQKIGRNRFSCKFHVFCGVNAEYFGPIRASISHYERAIRAGLASGDFTYVSYAIADDFCTKLALGAELEALSAEAVRYKAILARTKNTFCTLSLISANKVVATLMGCTRGRRSLDDDTLSEAALLDEIEKRGFVMLVAWHKAMKAEVSFLQGDTAGALSAALAGEAQLGKFAEMFVSIQIYFYGCLSILAEPLAGDAAERGRREGILARMQGKVAEYASKWPESFRHKHVLLAAELSRTRGEDLAAMDLYDRAIAMAKEDGFVQDEALANELCSRFYRKRGQKKVARAYMTDAYHGYVQWGATAKAEDLVAEHPQQIASAALGVVPRAGRPAESGPPAVTSLDAMSTVRAAQAIASEIVLDRVLDQFMRIVLENAGAQRAILVLLRDEGLMVEATATVNPDEVRVGLKAPLEESGEFAAKVVQYVASTRESVLLGDATADERFALPLDIAARLPRSVMCLAMTHQNRLTGVLFLENRSVRGAFTPARMDHCKLLLSQAGIAVANAFLYAHAQAVSEELRRANEGLEAMIARRTDELRDYSERLMCELIQRERAEEERAALQQSILGAQAARLAEMSSPLIPITDRIVVMPLIGTMDAERAERVLEAALHGVQSRGARVVILDVTGITAVDVTVAGTLLRTAAALRLLGTQVVLTGVRAGIAQTLVGLEVDLSAITTVATLQRGIALALRRTEERWQC